MTSTGASMLGPGVPGEQQLGWGLLVLTLVIGGALVLTTWFDYTVVQDASASVIRGQGTALSSALRSHLRNAPQRPPRPELLERALQEAPGVAYVAVLDPDSGELTQAGTSSVGLDRVRRELEAGATGEPILVGERALLLKIVPPNTEQKLMHTGLVPREQLDRVLIEFTPHEALALEASAERTLWVGASATVLLILTTLAFGRLLRNRADLERALERERQMAVLGEMSAVLAHEIKNPLASLKGHAQLLAEDLEPGSREHQKSERIVGEALRLEALCTELLDFVRCREVSPQDTELRPLLEACAESVPEANVELDLSAAPETWRLDPLRMRQVLANLLRNAIDAASAAKPIGIEAAVEDQALVIRVRDSGPGIPPGQEERIFEAFHTTRTRGTGLGLAVARRVTDLHGGEISARTHPAGGAELRVVLPGKVA